MTCYMTQVPERRGSCTDMLTTRALPRRGSLVWGIGLVANIIVTLETVYRS